MVLTRSTKKGSTRSTSESNQSHQKGATRSVPATEAGPCTAGAAYTLPSDEERMRQFRARFLSERRTFRDWVSKFWAQVEVHSGAYMFDMREHVIFYTLFAAIVYLAGKSLLTLVLRQL